MFDVQVISVSLSQKPIVSPYQRGTSAPSRGTAPSMLNSRPTWMFVMKLRATPARICTIVGVTMMWCSHGRVLVPAPHEAFGPAVLRRPLRAFVSLMVGLLHHALSGTPASAATGSSALVVPHAVPVVVARRQARMHVAAGPFTRHGGVGVLRRPAALLRLREQRFVVFLSGLERVGADDGFARIVAVAVAPRAPTRAVVADQFGRR